MKRGLPKGCTVDDIIGFPTEAARWLGVTVEWLKEHRHELPGVIEETRETVLFHPRTYLDARTRKH